MSAYMDLNGVPRHGKQFSFAQCAAKKSGGFQGFVVSDWESIASLKTHGFAADSADAAIRAVNAGVNMEMTSSTFRDNLAAAVKVGL